jgi:hypothetical protein
MVDALSVENARTTDDAMDFVSFVEEKFGKVRAVLAGDSCDEGFFHWVDSGVKKIYVFKKENQ